MSAPGAPITLVLTKVSASSRAQSRQFTDLSSQDQKGTFGLTLSQHDHGTWVQSVQPHGPADEVRERCLRVSKSIVQLSLSFQRDIRAGDQLMQINGTPVEMLKFSEIQDLLEHANSNQIHLTCVPYREPQAQPVVVNVSQSENLPSILLPSTLNRERSDSNRSCSRLAESDSSREDDPRTRSIVVGQETCIEIDRGQSGLGLSVVGGSDTQLVKRAIEGNATTTSTALLFLVGNHRS